MSSFLMPFSKKTNIPIDTEQKTVYHVRANKHKKRPHFGGLVLCCLYQHGKVYISFIRKSTPNISFISFVILHNSGGVILYVLD